MNQPNNHQIVLSPVHLITIVLAMAGLMMLTVLLTTNMIVNSETVSASENQQGGSKGVVSAATSEGCEEKVVSKKTFSKPVVSHKTDFGHVLGLSSHGRGGLVKSHAKSIVSHKTLFKPAKKVQKQDHKKVVKHFVSKHHKTVNNSYNTYNKTHNETNSYIKDSVVNQTQVSAGDFSSVNVNNVAANDSKVFQKNENNTTIQDNDTTVTTTNTDNSVNDSFNKKTKIEDSFNSKEINKETNIDVEIEDSFNKKNVGLLPRNNGPVLAAE